MLGDAAIHAMKRGNVLKVETELGSTAFSLMGFTAAYDDVTSAYNYVTSLQSLDEFIEVVGCAGGGVKS